MPINHLTKHRQCSNRVSAVAVWWCKRWLSGNRESATDTKSAGGHQDHLAADMHGHYHHPQRPISDEQPQHVAKCRSSQPAHSEWAAWNEHETLRAAALLVTGTRAVTARCTANNGRAWAGEQELCMVCSVMTAALACVTLVLELKEATARHRLELLTSGLNSGAATASGRPRIEEPRDGVAARCVRRSLRPTRPIRDNCAHTPY